MPRSPQWFPSLRFPQQEPIHSSLCNLLHSPITSSLLGPNIYSPQHHVLKHPQLPFLPRCQRPRSTPIQNNRQILDDAKCIRLTSRTRQLWSAMIPGFRREPDENRTLQSYYTASGGNSLPTFQDKMPLPSSSGPRKWDRLFRRVGKELLLLISA